MTDMARRFRNLMKKLRRDVGTLVLTIISVALFVTISIVTTNSLSAETKPNTAEWISAWATVAGSIGTAGALWVGAVTLQRQVQDRHRAQASRVLVRIDEPKDEKDLPSAIVSNLSDLPIYRVILRVDPRDVFGDSLQKTKSVLVGDMEPFPIPHGYLEDSVQAQFQDTAGTTWIRWVSGGLAENTGKKDVEFSLIE